MADDATDQGSWMTSSCKQISIVTGQLHSFPMNLKYQPVTLIITIDPHVSLEWDSERWIRLQFAKRTSKVINRV